jgi:GTP-binding protein EngB required for normal cell division
MHTTSELDLEDLLRKCHRHELLLLARTLRVRPDGLGRDGLARHLTTTLRRQGGHLFRNLQRGGKGPPYRQVLNDLLSRQGISSPVGLEDGEVALVKWALERSWGHLSPEEKQQMWQALGQSPPSPVDAVSVPVIAENQLQRRFAYVATSVAAGIVTRVVPFMGCLVLYWVALPDDRVVLPAVLEVARLRQQVRHRVTVGVVGSPSSGKDAAVKAIFGIDSGNVDPVAGSTTKVEIQRLPGSTALFVVNTPGLGDVVEAVTEEARQILDHIDVYVYVVNAQGGVQAREKADWEGVRATGRPALAVVNKIDTLRERDRERYLLDAREKLGADEQDFAAVAFDPLPQLSDTPIGVDRVRRWIGERLTALGKDRSELPWTDPSLTE